jgi:hypothetical protein
LFALEEKYVFEVIVIERPDPVPPIEAEAALSTSLTK